MPTAQELGVIKRVDIARHDPETVWLTGAHQPGSWEA